MMNKFRAILKERMGTERKVGDVENYFYNHQLRGDRGEPNDIYKDCWKAEYLLGSIINMREYIFLNLSYFDSYAMNLLSKTMKDKKNAIKSCEYRFKTFQLTCPFKTEDGEKVLEINPRNVIFYKTEKHAKDLVVKLKEQIKDLDLIFDYIYEKSKNSKST